MSEFVKTIGEINKEAVGTDSSKSGNNQEEEKINSVLNTEQKEGGDSLSGVHIQMNDSDRGG